MLVKGTSIHAGKGTRTSIHAGKGDADRFQAILASIHAGKGASIHAGKGDADRFQAILAVPLKLSASP